MTRKEELEIAKEIVLRHLSDISCDDCKWNNEGKGDEERKYYCEGCPGLKFVGWQCCERMAEDLAKEIINTIKH